MAARPVSASFGLLLGHVLSKSAPRASRLFPTVTLPRVQPQAVQYQARALTCSAPSRNSEPPKSTEDDSKKQDAPAEPEKSDKAAEPWYLQVEPPSQPPAHEPAPLPPIPAGSPEILEPVVKYVYEEMGLDDLNLLDLREFDPPPALGPNLLMLFGTARSERHLHVASGRLVRWLRYNYKLEADADGLIGPGEMKTKLRRLRRKAKLLGSSAGRGGDDGLSTGWICVNLGTIGGETDEAARFDADGQLSGFGNVSVDTGTTVVIQVMTQARREELNLEPLWLGSLERNRRQQKSFSSTPPKRDGSRQGGRPGAGSSMRSQPFSNQGSKRTFSTSLASFLGSEPAKAEPINKELQSPVHPVRRRLLQLRLANRDVAPELDSLLSEIYAADVRESHAADQIAVTDEVLQMLSRQNPGIITQDTLITLICAIARSGSKSPILARAQKNLETLMVVKQFPCPSDADLVRLLGAYAAQGNWDRFWDAWRQPPRFGRPRSEELYSAMFSTVAGSKDATACMEALRSCVPGMQFEEPPVFPVDAIYEPVLACLNIADPGAVATADLVERGEASYEFVNRRGERVPEGKEDYERVKYERMRDREFVQIVHDLRFARRQMEAASMV